MLNNLQNIYNSLKSIKFVVSYKLYLIILMHFYN